MDVAQDGCDSGGLRGVATVDDRLSNGIEIHVGLTINVVAWKVYDTQATVATLSACCFAIFWLLC